MPGEEPEIGVRELYELRSHELHMKFIYGLRLGGLFVSLVCIVIGAIMIFKGLNGSFNWAFEEAQLGV